MSNLECIGLCCFACIVPTVILGAFFFIVGAFFFCICKLFEYVYSKKSLFWKSLKTLCMKIMLEKVKIKLVDFKKEVMTRKNYYGKIAVLAFVLLAGIVIQILIEFGKFPCPIHVNNLNNISIAIVTIQATLFTLVISLLALVSNNDKIYFGFDVKDFYFNHCTKFLKQRNMMYIGIVLILLNTMFLHFDLHNIVYAVFLISLWLIFESAINVMRIFAGTDEAYKKEIEKYIDECLRNDRDVETIYNNFANDWKKKISYQDKSIDELYHQIYCKIYMYIIRKGIN